MGLTPFQKLANIDPLFFGKVFGEVGFGFLFVDLSLNQEDFVTGSLGRHEHKLDVDIGQGVQLVEVIKIEQKSS